MLEKIGTFRAWTGVSEATLRFYERLGLIAPSRDTENDYRYYNEIDFIRLIQIKQLSCFDIPLSELPSERKNVSIDGMCGVLVERRKALEAEIDQLYERLGRMKLHEQFFLESRVEAPEIRKANIRGIYRLFVSDPAVAGHPDAEAIAQRWLSRMPFAHATLRIPLSEIVSEQDEAYSVQVGIGMLERYFVESGETYRVPMQYSPPNTCIYGTISVHELDTIRRSDLEPFLGYMAEHSLVPQDDMFGWIVYIGREGGTSRYYLSLRIAVA